jgi:hypothetical protein
MVGIAITAKVRGLARLGQQRFVTPELKPNIVMLLIVFTNVEESSVEPVTKGKW